VRLRCAATHPTRRLAALSALLYLVTAAAVVMAGVGRQRAMDRYGVFGRDGSPGFVEVEPQAAFEMLDAFEPDYADYFHRIEIGSRLGYRHTFGHAEPFRRGEVVWILARLLQSHPALELRWELVPPDRATNEPDGRNEQPARFERRVDAAHSYASIGFRLEDDYPPGRYRIRLSARQELTAWEPVAELHFDLKAR
jgi:hypothetical protein